MRKVKRKSFWIDEYEFKWPVYEYYIDKSYRGHYEGGIGGKEKIYYPPGGVICIKPKSKRRKERKVYEPLKDDNLLFQLERIDENNEKSILKFVNKYGMLGLNSFYHKGNLVGDLVCEFQNEVRKLKDLLRFYEIVADPILSTQQQKFLKKRIYIDQNGEIYITQPYQPQPHDRIFVHSPRLPLKNYTLKDEDYISLAWYYLQRKILYAGEAEDKGSYLKSINPAFTLEPDGHPRACYRPRFLINAIYLQFYLLITETKKLKRCKGCQSLFAPERKNQDYCDYWCSLKTRQARFRARGKSGRSPN